MLSTPSVEPLNSNKVHYDLQASFRSEKMEVNVNDIGSKLRGRSSSLNIKDGDRIDP